MDAKKDQSVNTEQELELQAEGSMEAAKSSKGYKRVDVEGGVLTEEDDIEYFKRIQRRDVVNNSMLGEFNATGDYVIKEPMMKELVVMKKFLIDSYFNNVYFLKSAFVTRETGNLQFCVMIRTSEDSNKATAILKLLEPVTKAGGYIQNTNSFTVATYTDANDEYFLSKVKKVFRIYPLEDGIKQDEEEVAGIIAKLANRNRTRLLGVSIYTKVEKEHYDNRIDALKKGGFDDVLEELKALTDKAKVFLNPNDPNYFRTMNDLIDQAIDNIGRKNPKRLKDIKNALKAADKAYIEQSDEAENLIRGYQEKAELKDKLEKDAEMSAQLARQKEDEQAKVQQKKPQAKKPAAKPKAKAKKPVKKPVKKKEAAKPLFPTWMAVGQNQQNAATLNGSRVPQQPAPRQDRVNTIKPDQTPPKFNAHKSKEVEDLTTSLLNGKDLDIVLAGTERGKDQPNKDSLEKDATLGRAAALSSRPINKQPTRDDERSQ